MKLAQENAALLNLSHRVTFYKSELTSQGLMGDNPSAIGDAYDIIVSNPPYISVQERDGIEPEILLYEDHGALFAGADGLDCVRNILKYARTNLAVGGHLFLEVGLSHPHIIRSMLTSEHNQVFKLLAVHPDLTLRERFVEIQRIK